MLRETSFRAASFAESDSGNRL